jgi:hypothetical protein
MTCCWCGGYVPFPEGPEDTFCTQCGKGFRLLERVETWFREYWYRYVPL